MFATGHPASHDEAWLALPWLANGRISQVEREKLEPHVRSCTACRDELAFQRLLCKALTEPDRVTYAPGPSFRKLMDRIDGTPRKRRAGIRAVMTGTRNSGDSRHVSLWRPPGLAWAASFVLLVGIVGFVSGAYHSAQPIYKTTTDSADPDPNVLHIAFDRSVTLGEAAQALHSTGAHIVEGPDTTGVIGVALDVGSPGRTLDRLRVLSARLRADPRVRWVEPVSGDNATRDAQVPTSRGP